MSDQATNPSLGAEDVKGKGKSPAVHEDMNMDEAEEESESDEVSSCFSPFRLGRANGENRIKSKAWLFSPYAQSVFLGPFELTKHFHRTGGRRRR